MSSGKVITFYSYKGGVGRTLALANVAVCLAGWGHRVLCIDWDLEAPGLHLYFKDVETASATPGLVDLVREFSQGAPIEWRDYVHEVDAGVHIITAGVQDDGYKAKVQDLDWDDLYDRDLGRFLEKLRAEWTAKYDFVLLDSRTGISDVGSICTIQLPDIVVLLFTANEQSVAGAMSVAASTKQKRSDLPVGRGNIQFIPIASRFEGNVEKEISERWLGKFAQVTEPLYREWAHKDVSSEQLLTYLRVPYVPFWSFGEELPVIQEGTRVPGSIGYTFETVAALLSQELAGTDVLVSNRDGFVATARAGGSVTAPRETERFKYDLFMSYAPDKGSFARKVEEGLQKFNLTVFSDPGYLVGGDEWVDQSTRALQESKHFVLIAGKALTSWQKQLVMSFFSLTFSEQSRTRRIVPVALAGLDLAELPPILRQLSTIRADLSAPERAAADIGRAVLTAKLDSPEDDPQKGRWGGKAETNGRRLSATVTGDSWYRIELRVEATDPATPLSGSVTFHLHDTFNPAQHIVTVKHGVALLVLGAYGAFTVGVEADGGSTRLELDLAEIPNAPERFREN